jgi:hypothetical protein
LGLHALLKAGDGLDVGTDRRGDLFTPPCGIEVSNFSHSELLAAKHGPT